MWASRPTRSCSLASRTAWTCRSWPPLGLTIPPAPRHGLDIGFVVLPDVGGVSYIDGDYETTALVNLEEGTVMAMCYVPDAKGTAHALMGMTSALTVEPPSGDASEPAPRLDDEQALEGRLNLTGDTVITIDPVDARDFDDAISLERIERDHWRLGVHIADVSHFVRPKTALDREALERGTSVYLPDRVVPMLPELISNGLASLQPGRVRFTKTVYLEFSPEGARVATEFHNAAIHSKRRFTYEEVDDYLAHPQGWRSKLTPEVHALLGRMHELAMMLRARRLQRGPLECLRVLNRRSISSCPSGSPGRRASGTMFILQRVLQDFGEMRPRPVDDFVQAVGK